MQRLTYHILILLLSLPVLANEDSCLKRLKSLAGDKKDFILIETGMNDIYPMTITISDPNIEKATLKAQGIKKGEIYKVPFIGFKIDGSFKIKQCELIEDRLSFMIIPVDGGLEVKITENESDYKTESSIAIFSWSSTFELQKDSH